MQHTDMVSDICNRELFMWHAQIKAILAANNDWSTETVLHEIIFCQLTAPQFQQRQLASTMTCHSNH